MADPITIVTVMLVVYIAGVISFAVSNYSYPLDYLYTHIHAHIHTYTHIYIT